MQKRWLALGWLLLGGSVGTAASAAREVASPEPDEFTGKPVLNLVSPATEPDDPAQPEQAIGFYSKGSLVNADTFPPAGPGLLKIMVPRNRAWATRDLVQILSAEAQESVRKYPGTERLQIGDVANRNGGSIGSHESHQNGLDADVVYYRENRVEQDPAHNAGFEENFVAQGRVTANFDLERNWDFMSRLVATGRINRIFVDTAIKRALCEYAQRLPEPAGALTVETLRRLRPWPLHHDHMHVRILCPVKGSPRCIAQDEPPPGTSCADLPAD